MEQDVQEVRQKDALAEKLRTTTNWVLTIVFGLLPLIFFPSPLTSLEHTKVLVVMCGIAVVFILYSLTVLRTGELRVYTPLPLLIFWLLVVVSLASALISGDMHDALIGNIFGINTTVFVALLALLMSIWVLIETKKEAIVRLYMLFGASTVVLTLYHVGRLLLGVDFLSFGVFGTQVSTPVGSWNDLALFLGLTVLLALVTFEQLPLTKWGRGLFGAVVGVSLVMLAIINFFFVWVVLGVASLIVVVYSLGRGRFTTPQPSFQSLGAKQPSAFTLLIAGIVFVVSLLFIIGGSFFGGVVNKYTGVSYIEVRPSFEATVDVARGVYGENAFLGIGPNRFSDAWRLHKDQAINATLFWNTDFQSGIGYIPTSFVTTGVLGGVLWIAFFLTFVVQGARSLLRIKNSDRVWYFIATSSFTAAVFLWSMSFVYVPGVAILLLAALCTGVSFVSQSALDPERQRVFSLSANPRSGFLLTVAVMTVIITAVGSIYLASRHYASAYTFSKSTASIRPGTSLTDIEALITDAFELSKNDLYARSIAEYQLARLNTLLSVAEPTEVQQQQFQAAIANGINAGRIAKTLDPTDPNNWSTLGAIYSLLTGVGVEESYELGKEMLDRARELDPVNPGRYLQLAQLEARNGNFEEAIRWAKESVSLKSNYGDALYFLSQLYVTTGNVDAAVESARSVISLDPQNPSRYYQLGVLEASRSNFEAAVAALEAAIGLDEDYANARYFLALTYSELGRQAEAKAELEYVLKLNPDNGLVMGLLREIEENGRISSAAPTVAEQENQPIIEEEAAVHEENGNVTTTEDPDSPLLAPVNTPAETNEANNTTAGGNIQTEVENPVGEGTVE